MRTKNWTNILLIVLIAIVAINQARFLFVYPVPDTGMWFGDESWTMLTVRAMVHIGVACVPEALGSSLAHSNGFVNGSIWLSGMLYGSPAVLCSSISPVAIGRVVSFILSLLLLGMTFLLSKKIGTDYTPAMFGIFVLAISNVFYFSSHSARLDMITGLAVLLYFYLLVIAYLQVAERSLKNRWTFILPFLAVVSLAVYVHVPTLIALPMLYSLWRLGSVRSFRGGLVALSGGLIGVALLLGIYWVTTGSFSLLGEGYNQYYNVANSIPVLHLTSWRVQKINTIDRSIQMWQVAWPLVMLVVVGTVMRIWNRMSFRPIERFFTINVLLLLLGWCLFGGPAVFYNIYVMPVMAVFAAMLIAPGFLKRQVSKWLIPALSISLAVYAIIEQTNIGTAGQRLVNGNDEVTHSLLDPIASVSSPPLVLTDQPGENEVDRNAGLRLMTNHLLLFGKENKSVPDILREKHVRYLLLYSSRDWRSPFREIADSLYTLVAERTGTCTDLGRTYENPHWDRNDTIRLYTAKE